MELFTPNFKTSINPQQKLIQSEVIREYQKKMRIFIRKVQQQISLLIDKYQSELNSLKNQNKSLRRKLNMNGSANSFQSSIDKNNIIRNISPIKPYPNYFKQTQDSMCKLNIFQISPKNKQNSNKNFNQFKSYLDYEKEDLSLSRFQVEKDRKKKQQQKLLSTLESGKAALISNNSKLFQLLGKNQVQKQESVSSQQQVKSTKQISNSSLNQSLSLICESLDNSFHSKKSRRKHQQKRKQKQRIRQMRLQQARKHYKDRKEKGLQNLLKCIRQNLNSHENKPLQTLKSVVISNMNEQNQDNSLKNVRKQGERSSKSKVLINPDPIQMQRKQKGGMSASQSLTQKQPHSILKKNSTILSKSILSNLSLSS